MSSTVDSTILKAKELARAGDERGAMELASQRCRRNQDCNLKGEPWQKADVRVISQVSRAKSGGAWFHGKSATLRPGPPAHAAPRYGGVAEVAGTGPGGS
jgi:hypothetical protein